MYMHAWGFIVLNQVHDGEKHYSGQSLRVLVCQAKQRRTEVSSPSALSFPFSRPSEVKAKQWQGFLSPLSSLPVPALAADLTYTFSWLLNKTSCSFIICVWFFNSFDQEITNLETTREPQWEQCLMGAGKPRERQGGAVIPVSSSRANPYLTLNSEKERIELGSPASNTWASGGHCTSACWSNAPLPFLCWEHLSHPLATLPSRQWAVIKIVCNICRLLST